MDLETFGSSIKKNLKSDVCALITYQKIILVDITVLNNIKVIIELRGISYIDIVKELKSLREKTLQTKKDTYKSVFNNSECELELELTCTGARDDFKLKIKNKNTGGHIAIKDFLEWIQFCDSLIESILSSFYSFDKIR